MTSTPPDPNEPPENDERSGAGPMLATLAGILLSLVALGIILFRLFPSDAADEAIPTSSSPDGSVTTLATDDSSVEPSTQAPSTEQATTTTTALTTSVSTSSTVADDPSAPSEAAPQIEGLSVLAGSTTANVSFTTNTCVNARYDYDGASSGRHEGDGYPDTSNCWTEHLAQLGTWTPALVPDSEYLVDLTVIDAEGRTATATVSFTTSP